MVKNTLTLNGTFAMNIINISCHLPLASYPDQPWYEANLPHISIYVWDIHVKICLLNSSNCCCL